MRDNDLIRLFLPIISTGLTTAGYTGVNIKQGNQPTQQGVNIAPTVYFYKLGDKRYGFQRKISEWDVDQQLMTHTETQFYESQFQISALVLQNPVITNSYTASDLINEVSMILQSDYAISTLADQNVGILRISDVRNPYFVDDRDQFEAMPSFDFTLTYPQTRITSDPTIDSFEFDLYRV